MLLFVVGLLILVIGYFTYGKFVERILAPDDRPTPAKRITTASTIWNCRTGRIC